MPIRSAIFLLMSTMATFQKTSLYIPKNAQSVISLSVTKALKLHLKSLFKISFYSRKYEIFWLGTVKILIIIGYL